MKSTQTLFIYAILASVILSSCSKRTISSTNIDEYKKYSHQLEMDYAVDNSTLSASNNESEVILPVADARFEPAVASNMEISAKKENMVSRVIIKSERKMNLMEKIVAKKVEKMMNKKKITESKADASQNEVTGRLRTGIIIGAIGLLLLITAGFFGAAAPVIYVGGAVLFIIGIVFILLAVL